MCSWEGLGRAGYWAAVGCLVLRGTVVPWPDGASLCGRLQAEAAARVLADVLVDKYRDGLPLYRQIDRFKRLGMDIRR